MELKLRTTTEKEAAMRINLSLERLVTSLVHRKTGELNIETAFCARAEIYFWLPMRVARSKNGFRRIYFEIRKVMRS